MLSKYLLNDSRAIVRKKTTKICEFVKVALILPLKKAYLFSDFHQILFIHIYKNVSG